MPEVCTKLETAQPSDSLSVRAAAWERWLQTDPEIPAARATGRVLLISYEFPPTGGSGVQRPARLAKYLGSLGWEVEVLTADHDRFPWRDPSLLSSIPTACRVHRISGYEPACLARGFSSVVKHVLSKPAARWLEDRLYWRMIRLTAALGRGQGEDLWIGAATAAGLQIHRRRPFDAMISTGPPHFTHQVALRVQQATGLPWLADLRDPLVSDFSRCAHLSNNAGVLRRLEGAILRRASMIATTCPSLARYLRARYPQRAPQTIQSITNGFDRDDLRKALMRRHGGNEPAERFQDPQSEADDRNQPGASAAETRQCLFVAAGALYGRREIHKLVAPLGDVLARHPEWQGRVQLVLAGSIDAQQLHYWEQNRPDWLTLTGYLDHAAALRLTASAVCNLIMVPDCDHGRLSVPGKTFELMALPAHVLALASEDSDTAAILREAGAATIVPLEAPARVAAACESIIAAHFAGRLARQRDWPALNGYDRRVVALRFAECLTTIRRRTHG